MTATNVMVPVTPHISHKLSVKCKENEECRGSSIVAAVLCNVFDSEIAYVATINNIRHLMLFATMLKRGVKFNDYMHIWVR